MSEYRSNSDPARIAARLRAAKRVLVTPHAKPDGDAIGSSLAIARAIRAVGVAADIWLAGAIEFSLRPFLEAETIRDPAGSLPGDEYDLAVVVDTGSWVQLEPISAWLRPRSTRIIGIDHHRTGEIALASERIVEPECASTTQVLTPIIDAMGVPLVGGADGARGRGAAASTRDSIAEALYLGLATDTGWFRFSNATAPVYTLAARLLGLGVEKDRLYRQVEETARPERLKLLGRALASMEFLAGGTIAIASLSQEDFAATGGAAEDLSGIVNAPMIVGTVEMSVLVTQSEPGVVKVSFRSKPPAQNVGRFADVNAVAARYGGGGHIHAAGAKFKGAALADVLARLRAELIRPA